MINMQERQPRTRKQWGNGRRKGGGIEGGMEGEGGERETVKEGRKNKEHSTTHDHMDSIAYLAFADNT